MAVRPRHADLPFCSLDKAGPLRAKCAPMWRPILAVSCFAGALGLSACSKDEPSASKSYCAVAVEAASGRFNYGDNAAFESLVSDEALPERYRAAMTAAAERARKLWATSDAWSNDDIVEIVNSMCAVELTPVTMQP